MSNLYYPFVSYKAQLIFYLTQMDGRSRCVALKITESHYFSTTLAKKWLDNLLRELGPPDVENEAALDKLQTMYNGMTHRSDEENEATQPDPTQESSMQVRMIQHLSFANNHVVTLLKTSYDRCIAYYERGEWAGQCNMYDLVRNFIEVILGELAQYYVSKSGLKGSCFEYRFVLVTTRTGFKTDKTPVPYPVGFDLIIADPNLEMLHATEGDVDLMMNYWHAHSSILNKLIAQYRDNPVFLRYSAIDLPVDVIIKLVIKEVYASMQTGVKTYDELWLVPPARLCLTRSVTQETVNEFEDRHHIEIDSDLLWIPVIPEGMLMENMVDHVLFTE